MLEKQVYHISRINMAEDLIEKISLEDTVDEIDTDSEENEDDVKDEKKFAHNEEYLPSKITDEDYVFMPPLPEGFIDSEEWKSSGKWLLYVFGDMEKLDTMWTQLQPLLADGTLSRLKCSTARNNLDGVLMCYTSNSEDRRAVKNAADAIRNIVNFNYIMYYKTNEASESGLYLMHGDNRITKYMHTVACSLYERDKHKRWVKVFFE